MDPLAQLADAGFDLAHDFDTAALAGEPGLEPLAAVAGERRGVLVGNTRALWPRFVEAMRDPALARLPHPLDHYTERAIGAAFPGARVYYGHRRYDGAFVPLQRLAAITGLAAFAPTHLVIHPIYGPWFALRAVVLTAGEAPRRAPIARPCRCTGACEKAVDAAWAAAGPNRWQAWAAVRDACELRAARYSEAQIRYHYTKEWQVEAEGSGEATVAGTG